MRTQEDQSKRASESDQSASAQGKAQTGSNKETSNQISIPQIALPKGGGAIKSIDEKFSVNAINGTAAFSLPIPVSDARGFTPALGISYNSGASNGIFGLGWSLSLPSIKRKTDKALPKYFDAIDSDTFMISEAEDLVAEYRKDDKDNFEKDKDGNYIVNEFPSIDGKNLPIDENFVVRRYRPRIEGLFARIERWTENISGDIHWRVISKDNVTTLYGKNPSCRIADPADPKNKIFEWLIEFSYDDKGHCISYEYRQEDGTGIDLLKLHNKNRFGKRALFANAYLKRVRYGNISPYKNHRYTISGETGWMFETVFDYGEHETRLPFEEKKTWEFRPDAFSDYRAGFEIRTCRLCKRVLLTHHFKELTGGSAVIRSMDFTYTNNGQEGFTFLEEITFGGYTKHDDGSYTQKKLPPFSFTYQKHEWNKEVKYVSTENLINAPAGIDEKEYHFVDLFSEGLPGILTEQGDGWFYKSNWGEDINNPGVARFTPAKLVVPKPSFSGLQNNLQLVDLEADGLKQMAQWLMEPKGFFEINDEEEWQPFKSFQQIPNINFRDPNLRLVDLNGDGKADVLITEDEVFTWYPSAGKNGFDRSNRVRKTFDEEQGPAIVFADKSQSIFLADMSGDGLTDIVRIRNSDVCYWPNMGYGKFGAKVLMDNAPVFDHPEQFNPAFIHLFDLDGSGTTDIVYRGKNQFTFWLNQHGNSFLPEPQDIETFPEITNYSNVSVMDLLGNGMACLVWNCDLPQHQNQPLRYINLLNSKKPHILIGYKNNLGKEVDLEYRPSTQYYIEDKLSGTPWVTKLHFPVHCVSKVTMFDRIRKTRFASEYFYHHGYYDHFEREFRGFGRVDQQDAEDITHFIKNSEGAINSTIEADLHQPPVLTKTWFHTGAFLDSERILDQFKKDYNQLTIGKENLLPQPELPEDLSIDEWREALRSCKGMLLRKEVYALDGTDKQELPYAVEQHNCLIKILQPKGTNKYGVFLTHESEAITYHYERNAEDPRIAHSFIFDIDKYGNILQTASVVYPRKINPLKADEQIAMHIVYTENAFTNDINDTIKNPLDYRLPLAHFSKTYEVTGVDIPPGYYNLEDLKSKCHDTAFIDYEVSNDGSLQKRIIEYARQQYRSDDTITVLPFGVIEPKAIPHQSYKAAFNQAILDSIFPSAKISTDDLKTLLTNFSKGAYIFEDGYYWISSGTTNYNQDHFFLPEKYTDPFGNITTIQFDDSNYYLFIQKITDALKNEVSVEKFNYRTLSPYVMKDMNDNLSAVRFDELGMVVKSFVIGKVKDGKSIDKGDEFDFTKVEMKNAKDFAGAEMVYDIDQWLKQSTSISFDINNYKPEPNYVKTTIRETHYNANDSHETKYQEAYAYSDGGRHILLMKAQAEPGLALQKGSDGKCTEVSAAKRWVGNGRTILNNKGNPVMQYEPYFSTTFEFDDESEMPCIGVTPIIHYDPLGRVIRTDFPNGTFSEVLFAPWQQTSYDQNDTVLRSDWYKMRIGADATITAPEEIAAAKKTASHNDTPVVTHFDSLGRTFLTIADNVREKISTKTVYDIEGNVTCVIDALDRNVMIYQYGMLGNQLKTTSMDAGNRCMIHDVAGKPFVSWDDRNHEFSFEYDALGRPIKSFVKEGAADAIVFLRTEYGEAATDSKKNNLVGKTHKQYDQSGINTSVSYDFKGNLLNGSKQFAKEYKKSIDWKDVIVVELEKELFASSTEYDALNRPTNVIAPQDVSGKSKLAPSIFTPGYNEVGLLQTMDVNIHGAEEVTHFVTDINYNAKGQREEIYYWNNTKTSYTYEPETFRLKKISTTRKMDGRIEDLQNLNYTYDPVGNITQIQDFAQADITYDSQLVKALNEYEYDALYRLINATGREHIGQTGVDNNKRDDFNYRNFPFINVTPPGPNDANAFRNYIEKYVYDKAGNIKTQQHNAGSGSWTRTLDYKNPNNQLTYTEVGSFNFSYSYDAHGNMLNMEHLPGNLPEHPALVWDFHDQLHEVDLGGGGTAYYVYDGSGQRVRKIIVRNDNARRERFYIGAIEIYKEISGVGDETSKRETLHVMDDTRRIAMIDTKLKYDDRVQTQLIRYQYSNHLGSASLELDDAAKIISYEEYFPYGTTSYSTVDATREISSKRYRYTGKERDKESGLNYYGQRYYANWLCRWLTADPAGIKEGVNMFIFLRNNSIKFTDPKGTEVYEVGTIIIHENGPTTQNGKVLPEEISPIIIPKDESDEKVIEISPVIIPKQEPDEKVIEVSPVIIPKDESGEKVTEIPPVTIPIDLDFIQSMVDEEQGVPTGSLEKRIPNNPDNAEYNRKVQIIANYFLKSPMGTTLEEKLHSARRDLTKFREISDKNSRSLLLRDAQRYLYGRSAIKSNYFRDVLPDSWIESAAPWASDFYNSLKMIAGDGIRSVQDKPTSAVGGGAWYDKGLEDWRTLDEENLNKHEDPKLYDPDALPPHGWFWGNPGGWGCEIIQAY